MIRRMLDGLYLASAVLACVFFASIAAMVVLQVFTRIAGIHVAGLIDYSTYAMVAATFFGLAYALKRDAHIRVTLLLFAARGRVRRALQFASLAIGSAVMVSFAWHASVMAYESWLYGMRDLGLAATPLWIPQSGMAAGAVIAAIAFLDELVLVARGREPTYAAEAAKGVLDEAGHHDGLPPGSRAPAGGTGDR